MAEDKLLETMLFHGKISRREFLVRAAALGLTAAVPVTALAPPAQASSPLKGGQFRIGFSDCATSDILNPAISGTNCGLMIGLQMRNLLVEEAPGPTLIPELAESWESTTDVKKWIFNLRKGVAFHNGKSFEAEDVIFSLNLHRGENSKSPAKGLLSAVTDIRAQGKHQVIFELDAGNVDFPAIMAYIPFQIVPANTTDFDKGIGTGGYVLESFEPGVMTVAKRNPNYWKEDRAHFDEVVTLGIADVNTRTNALRSDEIDVMSDVDLKTIDLLKKVSGVEVLKISGKRYQLFCMRTDKPPFTDNNVRLALKYAIDREEIIKKILGGYGSVGNDHPISSSYKFFDPDLPIRQYDPDKAKFHLKQAKMEDYQFTLNVADAPFPGAVDTAILYQQHAAKAGIKIKVVREPNDGYWSNVWMKKAWTASAWSGRITEDIMFSQAYASGVPWNETFWKNERFDELLVKARTERDEAERRAMYHEMQRLVRDDGGALIMMFSDQVLGIRSRVKHDKLSGAYQLDGNRAHERWWFES